MPFDSGSGGGSGIWLKVGANLELFKQNVASGVANTAASIKDSLNLPVSANTTSFEQNLGSSLSRIQERTGRLLEYAVVGTAIEESKRFLEEGVSEYASQLQQQQQAINIFGQQAGQGVQAFANNSVSALGETHEAALETVNQYGRIFEAAGEAPASAAEQSVALTQRIADVAGATGLSQQKVGEIIDTAVRGGQRGLIMLKELGVGVNQAQLEADGLAQGLVKATDPDKLVQMRDHINQLKDEIAKGTAGPDPRKVAEAQDALLIAQATYAKKVSQHGPNWIESQKARESVAKAQDALVKAEQGGSMSADDLQQKRDQLNKAQNDYNDALKGSVDLQDINTRETLVLGEVMKQTAKDAGDWAKSPVGQFQSMKAAIEQAKISLGAGLYPVVQQFAGWVSTHQQDIQNFAQGVGNVVGQVAGFVGNTVGFLSNNWDRIKPILEAITLAFAVDRVLKWGSTLLGVLTQAARGDLFTKALPNLSSVLYNLGLTKNVGAPQVNPQQARGLGNATRAVATMNVTADVVNLRSAVTEGGGGSLGGSAGGRARDPRTGKFISQAEADAATVAEREVQTGTQAGWLTRAGGVGGLVSKAGVGALVGGTLSQIVPGENNTAGTIEGSAMGALLATPLPFGLNYLGAAGIALGTDYGGIRTDIKNAVFGKGDDDKLKDFFSSKQFQNLMQGSSSFTGQDWVHLLNLGQGGPLDPQSFKQMQAFNDQVKNGALDDQQAMARFAQYMGGDFLKDWQTATAAAGKAWSDNVDKRLVETAQKTAQNAQSLLGNEDEIQQIMTATGQTHDQATQAFLAMHPQLKATQDDLQKIANQYGWTLVQAEQWASQSSDAVDQYGNHVLTLLGEMEALANQQYNMNRAQDITHLQTTGVLGAQLNAGEGSVRPGGAGTRITKAVGDSWFYKPTDVTVGDNPAGGEGIFKAEQLIAAGMKASQRGGGGTQIIQHFTGFGMDEVALIAAREAARAISAYDDNLSVGRPPMTGLRTS